MLIVSLALFIAGLALRRGACDPLKDPSHDQIFTSYIDKFIDVNKFVFPDGKKGPASLYANQQHAQHQQQQQIDEKKAEPLRISQIISECHRNKSIFDVFRFEEHFNIKRIEEFPKKYGIEAKLKELSDNIQITSDIQILSSDAHHELNELARSDLNDFGAYKFVDNLTKNITHYNLIGLADRLKVVYTRLSNGETRSKIQVQELHLRSYQSSLVEPLLNGTDRLLELANSLDEKLHFKQMSFEQAIKKLIKEVEEAEKFINTEGTSYVQRESRNLLDNFNRNINAYLSLVINVSSNEIGRCEPISNVYNATIVSVCNRVVDPFVSCKF